MKSLNLDTYDPNQCPECEGLRIDDDQAMGRVVRLNCPDCNAEWVETYGIVVAELTKEGDK